MKERSFGVIHRWYFKDKKVKNKRNKKILNYVMTDLTHEF